MKRNVAEFVLKCMICQQVKAEQKKPGGLLHPLEVPQWKWDSISMDFIDGLPRSRRGNTSIWVIVDRLTKIALFIPVKSRRNASSLASIYLKEIVRLNGIPSSIVSSRSYLYERVLEEFARGYRHTAMFKHNLSPSNRWSDRKGEQSTGRSFETVHS